MKSFKNKKPKAQPIEDVTAEPDATIEREDEEQLVVAAEPDATIDSVVDPVPMSSAPPEWYSEHEVMPVFNKLHTMLSSTERRGKQSRQLRLALKALVMAKEAAQRHFTHL